MPAIRSLPARPSIEFEKKEAKALLRLLHAGDAEALARARAQDSAFADAAPESFQLAHAQLIQAREYGFASWPRLVRYFEEFDQQQLGRLARRERSHHREQEVEWLLHQHPDRRTWTARALAAYVPRFYALPLTEIFNATVTLDEARLAVARTAGAPTWEAFTVETRRPEKERDPVVAEAVEALKRGKLPALQQVIAAHPEHPSLSLAAGPPDAHRWNLLRTALHLERTNGRETMRPIVEWLVARGLDLQQELDLGLCGHMGMTVEDVRWFLDRGADPNWVAPSGIPVLEHALLRYWNGAAVDLVAARARPRQALWIAAGLGDIDGVRRSLDGRGRPTPEATALRPPFDAIAPGGMASHPEPDDEELLMEALVVAAFNERTGVIEYLASRGAPLNSLGYGNSLLSVAVGNAWVPVTEMLIRCGADLDLRGWMPEASPRELARESLSQMPDQPARLRIAELCGVAPKAP